MLVRLPAVSPPKAATFACIDMVSARLILLSSELKYIRQKNTCPRKEQVLRVEAYP